MIKEYKFVLKYLPNITKFRYLVINRQLPQYLAIDITLQIKISLNIHIN